MKAVPGVSSPTQVARSGELETWSEPQPNHDAASADAPARSAPAKWPLWRTIVFVLVACGVFWTALAFVTLALIRAV